jgi:ATP adenylyltransferase
LTNKESPVKIAPDSWQGEGLMENIWAPWRIEFIKAGKPEGCFLCDKPKESNDITNYILHRAGHNFIILNSYPYNPGHLLVAPYRHVANLPDLTRKERSEHFELVSRCVQIVDEVIKPVGFNIGINIGSIAGAGVDDHVHTHIVPRWQGDTNYMPIISNTRVIPEALAETYSLLKGVF